jgi:hypothetical protein
MTISNYKTTWKNFSLKFISPVNTLQGNLPGAIAPEQLVFDVTLGFSTL